MNKPTHDDLCSMKLHEFRYLPGPERISILRVPGGCIYTNYSNPYSTIISSCFVPPRRLG